MSKEKPLTVLIIEDEQMYRSLALQVFDGCDKITAVTAEDGFNKFKEFCPDITLLDIGLPDKSGLDLLPDLIGHDPEAFVIILTSSRISVDVEKSKKHGAAGYIIKPFTHNKLAECMTKYHAFKRKLNELSPDERAGNLIKNLRLESVERDLKKELAEIKQKEEEERQKALHEAIQKWDILFVDDYPTNRQRAGKQLQNLGCHVDIAASGEEVLALLESGKQYNLIFLDSHMSPGMDGFETAEEIRYVEARKFYDKKCIIIGMIEYSNEVDESVWKNAGMDDFLPKPARFSQLREMIEKYINLEKAEKS